MGDYADLKWVVLNFLSFLPLNMKQYLVMTPHHKSSEWSFFFRPEEMKASSISQEKKQKLDKNLWAPVLEPLFYILKKDNTIFHQAYPRLSLLERKYG